ncbi:hypothetical protein PC113_g2157 [Phytophthora cactorum]|uniref:Uncharacterized protein n=1 Tax=Phytophthora cactorum TaxID=29920 RepID=A0A8T0ZX98_9STRA|nr:hypothetical protein PC113_g2157 [Phytophthora cactorum]KAG2909182.1 hypothetical protein PC115_g13343 [Phytophthora cactorum]KAG2922173.1 hypothetical protein PC114_g5364 [Phytophthora cactorum]
MLSRHPDYDPCTTSGRHAAGDAEDEEDPQCKGCAPPFCNTRLFSSTYSHEDDTDKYHEYRGARTQPDDNGTTRAFADWTARTLINPGQQRRSIAYREASGATEPAVASFMNFDPNPEPQHRDAAVVRDLVQRHESVTRYVRDAVATAVDRQKEYADQRWRKNLEEKNCRRRSFFFYLRPAFNLP